MKADPVIALMAELAPDLAKSVAELVETATEIGQLEATKEEVDERGNPTKAAHRAHTRLRNPFLVEETPAKSRHKVEEQERKQHLQMVKAASAALKSYAMWRQYRSKLDVLDDHDRHTSLAGRSREDHDAESVFALGYPLLERLAKEKVSPSSFGRLPQFAMRFIADLIKAYTRDPKFDDPANPWVLIVRAGVLEANRGDLSDDEKRVVAHARVQRDGQASEWAAKARDELDLPPTFSQDFLEGAARLADATRQLTGGEAAAYYSAYGLQRTGDIEVLGKLLGLKKKSDPVRLATLVDFVCEVRPHFDRDMNYMVQLAAMKQAIDAIEPHAKLQRDWIAELKASLQTLGENLADSYDSIEAFDLLFRHGLQLSDTVDGFALRRQQRDEIKLTPELSHAIHEACDADATFKIVNDQVVRRYDPEYSGITAAEWTRDGWIAMFGGLPGEPLTDDDGESPPAIEPIAAVETTAGDDRTTLPPGDLIKTGQDPQDAERARTLPGQRTMPPGVAEPHLQDVPPAPDQGDLHPIAAAGAFDNDFVEDSHGLPATALLHDAGDNVDRPFRPPDSGGSRPVDDHVRTLPSKLQRYERKSLDDYEDKDFL